MENSNHRVVAKTPDVQLTISHEIEPRQENIGEIPDVDQSSFKASIVDKLHSLIEISGSTARLILRHPVTGEESINTDEVRGLELDEEHEEIEKDEEGNPIYDAEGNIKKIKNKHVKLIVGVGAGAVLAWFSVYEISRAVKKARPQNKQ